jgi:diguanylate cyclase (GGDEF)-like protein
MSNNDANETSGHYRSMASVLDSLDAAVYVCDIATGEMLFLNQYGRNRWGEYRGRKCWQVLQAGQKGPCAFCTNHLLLDEHGEPNPPYVWEFQNSRDGRWYQCRDQAIRWGDGRMVRMEIATDITERKNMELEVEAARRRAEVMANTDDLTGLNNRRAFFALGESLLKEAARRTQAIAVLMLDLDHFKLINDSFGHDAGDKVLCSFARVVKPLIRERDILARTGGEEFAILMTDVTRAQSIEVAERLRSAVESCIVNYCGRVIRPTVSIGVALCEEGTTALGEMLSRADEALLIAKRHGRNRVEHARVRASSLATLPWNELPA